MVLDSRALTNEQPLLADVWRIHCPAFEQHGVFIAYNDAKRHLVLEDMSASEAIVGNTALDRHTKFQCGLVAVSEYLNRKLDRQIQVSIAPSSIGLEPLSLARWFEDRSMMTSQARIYTLDVNAAFTACFQERAYPTEILKNVSGISDWEAYIQSADDNMMKFSNGLYDWIDVQNPGSILDDGNVYDVTATFNLLYHLPPVMRFLVVKHLCEHTQFMIGVDRDSLKQHPRLIAETMSDNGFVLDRNYNSADVHSDPIFIREEHVAELQDVLDHGI
jgi:hypothetical protein